MKFSTKERYGLRALIDLAVHSDDAEPVSISSIAGRQDISEAYLEQLMAKLKRAGLVVSSRGAQGGYKLAKPAEEISVGDVLRAVEGNLDAVSCPGLSTEGCEGSEVCVSKYVWQRINVSSARSVDGIRLDKLVEESRSAWEKFRKPGAGCSVRKEQADGLSEKER